MIADHGARRFWGVAMVASLLAGCCDKDAMLKCREQQAEDYKLLRVTADESDISGTPMRLEMAAVAGVAVKARVKTARCEEGRGTSAEVALDWELSKPGVHGVRILVASGAAGKVWMEAGTKGQGMTGPWVNGGALISIEDQVSGQLLGEVRAIALPCAGS